MPLPTPWLWPRRLRWRLVLGFALTVALLQAVLAGTERLLLEGTLIGSMRQSLGTTITTGLSSAQLSQPAGLAGAARTTFASKNAAGAGKTIVALMLAANSTAARLPALANALALPNQPVAMLDTDGRAYAHAGSLAGDTARIHALAPAVMAGLLAAARRHLANIPGEWTQQVTTGDGPYLLLLRRTQIVLPPRLPPKEHDLVLRTVKRFGVGGIDPGSAAVLGRLLGRPPYLVVMIAHRLGETEQTVATVTAISLGGALAVIALSALLSLVVVGQALRPLAAITHAAERLAEGDYRYRVALATGTDEVGRLAAAFDGMAAAIAAAFATQRRFVADASHELRTPLTALRGYTDVLLMGVDEDRETADRILHAMQEDLGRMSRLVDDLLTLARLDGGMALQLRPIVVSDLVGAAAHEGRALARGRQQIVEGDVPHDMVVWGDRDRLRQVLSNIVGNACAYCPPESLIWLRARACSPWAVLEVQDDGPGILPADLERLGERFYRGDAARSRQAGGSGLGLAIARAIVEAHGGALAITSSPGEGTTVTIRLPLARVTLPAALPGTASSSPRA